MFAMTRELAVILGIDPIRLRLEWISSAEGTKFAQVATEFTRQAKAIGPSPLRKAA